MVNKIDELITHEVIKKVFSLFGVIFLLSGLFLSTYLTQYPQKTQPSMAAPKASSFYTKTFASNTVPYYASAKPVSPSGIYDPVSNKTFIAYSSGIKNGYSAASPYIIEYNHSTDRWSNEIKIANSPVYPDLHNYPQLIIDDSGFLHVFQTFHFNSSILHATSINERDISSWTYSYIPNTSRATYGAAFKAKNGDFYISFRNSKNLWYEANPWYEPEGYIKSTDNGNSWNYYDLIDPTPYDSNGWNTIYVKEVHYEENPEGLHIVFGVHKNHNDYFNKHYYVFFSFDDNHIYSAAKQDLGTEITRTEFESCCELFSYSQALSSSEFGMAAAIDVDKNGSPHIFYIRNDTAVPESFKGEIVWATFQNGVWNKQVISEVGSLAVPFDVEYHSANNIDLYLRAWKGSSSPTYQYNYNGTRWSKVRTISSDELSAFRLVKKYNYKLKATFVKSNFPDDIPTTPPWQNAPPIGTHHAYGLLSPPTPTPTPTPTPAPTSCAQVGKRCSTTSTNAKFQCCPGLSCDGKKCTTPSPTPKPTPSLCTKYLRLCVPSYTGPYECCSPYNCIKYPGQANYLCQ